MDEEYRSHLVHCISLCDLVWEQLWQQHRRKNTSGTVPFPSHGDNVPADFSVRFNASVSTRPQESEKSPSRRYWMKFILPLAAGKFLSSFLSLVSIANIPVSFSSTGRYFVYVYSYSNAKKYSIPF